MISQADATLKAPFPFLSTSPAFLSLRRHWNCSLILFSKYCNHQPLHEEITSFPYPPSLVSPTFPCFWGCFEEALSSCLGAKVSWVQGRAKESATRGSNFRYAYRPRENTEISSIL